MLVLSCVRELDGKTDEQMDSRVSTAIRLQTGSKEMWEGLKSSDISPNFEAGNQDLKHLHQFLSNSMFNSPQIKDLKEWNPQSYI